MAMDKTHTIKSLTDDILKSVEARDSLEKTASSQPKELRSELGRELMTIATDLRKLAENVGDVSFDDLRKFASDMGSEQK